MTDIRETITRIVETNSWDQRIAQIRLIPHHHGTNEHPTIYAEIARLLYVPHLSADFAYIHEEHFYSREFFNQVYEEAHAATAGFTRITEEELTSVLENNPRTLLVFRTITGLRKGEFAHATIMNGCGADWFRPLEREQSERNGAEWDRYRA